MNIILPDKETKDKVGIIVNKIKTAHPDWIYCGCHLFKNKLHSFWWIGEKYIAYYFDGIGISRTLKAVPPFVFLARKSGNAIIQTEVGKDRFRLKDGDITKIL